MMEKKTARTQKCARALTKGGCVPRERVLDHSTLCSTQVNMACELYINILEGTTRRFLWVGELSWARTDWGALRPFSLGRSESRLARLLQPLELLLAPSPKKARVRFGYCVFCAPALERFLIFFAIFFVFFKTKQNIVLCSLLRRLLDHRRRLEFSCLFLLIDFMVDSMLLRNVWSQPLDLLNSFVWLSPQNVVTTGLLFY